MIWTTDKPTIGGWYWRRCFAITTGDQTLCEVVHIDDDGWCGTEGDYVDMLGGEWAGPIEPPDAEAGRREG